jgi:DnaK suppressor protein
MTAVRDLPDIRSRLLARRAELADREGRARRDAAHRFDPVAADFADQAVERGNDATLVAIAAVATRELSDLDTAVQRLDAGQYGLCVACGASIEPARLAAVPEALRCASCAA